MVSSSHRLAFFGGTFDPLHNGHLMLIEETLRRKEIDSLLLCPAYQAPLRESQTLFSGHSRLEMVQAISRRNSKIQAFDHEIRSGKTCFTYETLLEVKKSFPQHEISLLLGADQFNRLSFWKYLDLLVPMVHFLIFNREGNSLAPPTCQSSVKYSVMENPIIDISSTEIRELLKNKQPISHLVPEEINSIIQNSFPLSKS